MIGLLKGIIILVLMLFMSYPLLPLPSKARRFSTFPLDTSGVSYTNNNINQTSWKTTAQRVMAEAGVEDKTRVADVDDYPSWRVLPMFNIPADAIID